MHVSPRTLCFIKGEETGAEMVDGHQKLLPKGQPALTAYYCPAGKPTIGWGQTGPSIRLGLTWTLAQCQAAFDTTIARLEAELNGILSGVPTTQGQYDALASFAYNCGIGALMKSTLLRYHKASNITAAADEFGRWTNHGMPGLVTRRAVERSLYLS